MISPREAESGAASPALRSAGFENPPRPHGRGACAVSRAQSAARTAPPRNAHRRAEARTRITRGNRGRPAPGTRGGTMTATGPRPQLSATLAARPAPAAETLVAACQEDMSAGPPPEDDRARGRIRPRRLSIRRRGSRRAAMRGRRTRAAARRTPHAHRAQAPATRACPATRKRKDEVDERSVMHRRTMAHARHTCGT